MVVVVVLALVLATAVVIVVAIIATIILRDYLVWEVAVLVAVAVAVAVPLPAKWLPRAFANWYPVVAVHVARLKRVLGVAEA